MTHYSDDDLVLCYYRETGQPPAGAEHLESCQECRARYEALAVLLDSVMLPEPHEPGERYGFELWHRIAPRLPERVPFWRASWVTSLSMAAAAVLLAVGFVAGRAWPRADAPPLAFSESRSSQARTDIDETSRRVLLAAVADHLERSGRVLTDLGNISSEGDISVEQQWASDLLSAGRFYRQDALTNDERAVAAVLDDLERALIEIVHGPSRMTKAEIEQMHRRQDSAALLFKVRVLSGALGQRKTAPSAPASTPSPTPRTS